MRIDIHTSNLVRLLGATLAVGLAPFSFIPGVILSSAIIGLSLPLIFFLSGMTLLLLDTCGSNIEFWYGPYPINHRSMKHYR